jgi:ribonuclease G
MENKLILDVQDSQISIALAEDGRLVEFSRESRVATFSVGNIYVAKVKKIMPGLNSAFIDVGFEKEGFLHYLDLGLNFSTIKDFFSRNKNSHSLNMKDVRFLEELPKDDVVSSYLKVGDTILVQVVKEPISTKGPRLTTEISIAGRNLVFMPFTNKVSVSTKIKAHSERNRLRKIVAGAKLQNCGAIIRTVAEGKSDKELLAELKSLEQVWNTVLDKIQSKKDAPYLVYEELSRAESILRDRLNSNFDQIVVNDRAIYEDLHSYITQIEPERADIVKFYDDTLPIFDVYNLTKQIKSSFGKIVPFKKGAYLVIEHTEALHVIDVNSGVRNKNSKDQEDNAFEVNMAAVEEVARQVRLRDLGGIIIIDLIDMRTAEHKQAVYERMCEVMENDATKHNVLPLSKFGLMQITRQRVRPATVIDTKEKCPTCGGVGSIRYSLLFIDLLKTKIDWVRHQLKYRKFTLFVHPFVYAYLKQGFPSLAFKLRMKYGLLFKILPNQSFSLLEYKFVNRRGEEIDVTDSREMA